MTGTEGKAAPSGDLGAFRLTEVPHLVAPPRATPQPVRCRRSGLFVKGPIDWAWLAAAARLPGKALHVAMALRQSAGMQRSGPVALSGARLKEAGVSRYAAYRGLCQLEQAELVDVTRHRGRQPRVTILESNQ